MRVQAIEKLKSMKNRGPSDIQLLNFWSRHFSRLSEGFSKGLKIFYVYNLFQNTFGKVNALSEIWQDKFYLAHSVFLTCKTHFYWFIFTLLPVLKGYIRWKTILWYIIVFKVQLMNFFIIGKNCVLFSKYLGFCVIHESANFNIYDVIIDLTAY